MLSATYNIIYSLPQKNLFYCVFSDTYWLCYHITFKQICKDEAFLQINLFNCLFIMSIYLKLVKVLTKYVFYVDIVILL